MARTARLRLPRGALAYLETGGEGECTLRRSRDAFDPIEFLPVQPRDVGTVDPSTTVLGDHPPLPLALSPVGAARLFHHEGERAVARAARHAGVPSGISTLATTAVEDVAAATTSPLWFQVYLWGDRREAEEAIRRAPDAMFDGAVVWEDLDRIRQLDHLPATIDVLPDVVDAVADRLDVLVDSGFRRGSDIAAALALGPRPS